MSLSISSIRTEYTLAELSEHSILKDPFLQFGQWFHEAVNAEIEDVNAMTLATSDSNNKPHARTVLLKGVENNQFVFFTNYLSQKGKEIAANPFVSLLFYWKELQRQVRIEGRIEKISEADSLAYFHARPVESQIGAWASNQSEILSDRNELEQRMEALSQTYANQVVPKPPHWGGFAVIPTTIEFWQGRASRLHDRLVFNRQDENEWQMTRLNP